GSLFRAATFDQLHAPDRDLVKRHERHREADHADGVRRRDDRGKREDSNDGITLHAAKLRRGDDTHTAEKRQQNRQLKGETEREDQGHHEIEILADLGLKLDAERAVAARGFVADEELDREGQHYIENERRSDQEQHRRGDDEWQESIA